MRLRLPAQTILIPLSLLCSAVAFFPARDHHNLLETSPLFETRAAADRWSKGEALGKKCLAWSTDVRTVSEGGGWPTPEAGPWFSTLRCNQSQIYWRMAVVFFGPWLIMNLVLILFDIVMPRTTEKH
jgi:hypothetical protein